MTKQVQLRSGRGKDQQVLYDQYVPEGECLSVTFLIPPKGKMRWYARPIDSHKWQPVSDWFGDLSWTWVEL